MIAYDDRLADLEFLPTELTSGRIISRLFRTYQLRLRSDSAASAAGKTWPRHEVAGARRTTWASTRLPNRTSFCDFAVPADATHPASAGSASGVVTGGKGRERRLCFVHHDRGERWQSTAPKGVLRRTSCAKSKTLPTMDVFWRLYIWPPCLINNDKDQRSERPNAVRTFAIARRTHVG